MAKKHDHIYTSFVNYDEETDAAVGIKRSRYKAVPQKQGAN